MLVALAVSTAGTVAAAFLEETLVVAQVVGGAAVVAAAIVVGRSGDHTVPHESVENP